MKEPNLNVEEVGARIRKFRTNLQLSQNAFAKMASISPLLWITFYMVIVTSV